MKKWTLSLCLALAPALGLQAQNKAPAEAEVRSAYVLSLKDFGSEDIAYLSLPQTAPEIAVVVLPGLMGLSKEAKAKCDVLAGQGFIVLAVDLFNGQIPRDQADAMRMNSEVRADSALKTIEAGRRFFSESPRFKTPKAVLMSWTVNTSLALRSVNKIPDFSGLVLAEPWLKKGEKIEYPKIPTLLLCSQQDSAGMWLAGELRGQSEARLINVINFPEAPGFLASPESENKQRDAWGSIINFIRRCGQGGGEKGFLDKIF